MEISKRLHGYLKSWYTTSTSRKIEKSIKVTLTFDEFVSLLSPNQLATLERSLNCGWLEYLQTENNPYALVLTWKSYSARSSRVFSVETATVCSRHKSKQINIIQKGDAMRPEHREAISKGKKGKPLDTKHKENISKGKKGKKIKGWSEERKAARRALLAQKTKD